MSLDQSLNKILIIDFGSQFTQLIARRIRELGVFSAIVSHKKIKVKDINNSIKGIILARHIYQQLLQRLGQINPSLTFVYQ